jgi:chromosome partitioning protein
MKIFSLVHQKGGVGKSTLTFNLANNLKDYGKVCILDVDYQGSLYEIRENSDIPIFHISQLEEVRNLNYDLVFIDTPPYIFEELETICKISDVILVPMKPGPLDMLAVKKTIHFIKEYKAQDKALIVFNMVKPKTSLTEQINEVVSTYDIPISNNSISDLVVFSRSVLVNGVESNNNAQRQLDKLTKEILLK